jgi:glycogen synthase
MVAGIDLCADAVPLLHALGATLVVMGLRTTPDADPYLRRLRLDGAVLIDDAATQERYGPLVRAAADVVLVPSKTEAFGLVAAEGLAFGALVVTTGVGGLRDFLVRGRASAAHKSAHSEADVRKDGM